MRLQGELGCRAVLHSPCCSDYKTISAPRKEPSGVLFISTLHPLSFLSCLSRRRLLSPQLEPSASLFVGPLLSQLVRRMPAQMAPILRPLVAAIVARMAAKRMPSLSISLLLVIARLVRCCTVSCIWFQAICLVTLNCFTLCL